MTIKKTADAVKEQLKAAGIESPLREARFLVESLCKLHRGDIFLHGDMILTDEEQKRIDDAVQKRLGGFPLQYLAGIWEFYSCPFFVGEGVLIPRPETELLVDKALSSLQPIAQPVVADLCSGSGCVAVAIARKRQDARLTAVEKSPEAFAYLERNVEYNKAGNVLPLLADALGPITKELTGTFDMIVCNPPYITTQEMKELSVEVGFEPAMALDGLADGLHFYRELTPLWKPCLKPGGAILYEIGFSQAKAVAEILEANGFEHVTVTTDLSGLDRVVAGWLPKEGLL